MPAIHPALVNEERPFALDELFFSTTDLKGVIRYGNRVFTRVSGYEECELIGAAHNIIRHPDMPRGVFKLLWEYVKSGRTIAAYVKNLAKDGRYYWVLAAVMPCQGGYVSVRLKPSSPLLESVQAIYQQALAVERRIETDPSLRKQAAAAGEESLAAQLAAAGFASYDQFMEQALSLELASRREALAKPSQRWRRRGHWPASNHAQQGLSGRCRRIQDHLATLFSSLERLKPLQHEFVASATRLEQTSHWIQNASLNATITSQTMGAEGRVLAEVARLLRESSCETIDAIKELSLMMSAISRKLGSLAFDVAITELQIEVCTYFVDELQVAEHAYAGGDDLRCGAEESLAILFDQLESRTRVAYDAAAAMRSELSDIRRPLTRLSRLLGEMRMVQFSGRKESLAHPHGREFAAVFEDVARRVRDSTSVCSALIDSIAACEATLEDAAAGRRAVLQDVHEARLATLSLPAV